jgi:hypothetical protein
MTTWEPVDQYNQRKMELSAGHAYQLLGSGPNSCFVGGRINGTWDLLAQNMYGGVTFSIESPKYSSGFIKVGGPDAGSFYVVMLDPALGDLDTDGDGFTNEQEQNAGTDPENAASAPGNAGTDPETLPPETKSDVGGAATGISALDEIIAKLSPDFSAFSGAGSEDFSLTIPVEIGSYSTTWTIGPFDSLLDGKILWIRTTVRLFITAIMVFVFLRNLIKVLKEW